MNSLFETTYPFLSYSLEHLVLLGGFVVLMVVFIRNMKQRPLEQQRKVLMGVAILLSSIQILKIPVNLYTGVFDITKDIPLHMCNFLPFILIWVYATKNRTAWATIFFWIVLGVSQANLTPTIEYSLFHYDSVRYWTVHLGLVLLGLYPIIVWGWDLELKDIGRTLLWLNVAAVIIYGANALLGSNYLYVMGKPEGTTFFSILPPWPTYLIVLEVIVLIWAFMVYGIFKLIKRRSLSSGS